MLCGSPCYAVAAETRAVPLVLPEADATIPPFFFGAQHLSTWSTMHHHRDSPLAAKMEN